MFEHNAPTPTPNNNFKNLLKDEPLTIKDTKNSNYQAPFDLESCHTALGQHGRYESGMSISSLKWLATVTPGVPINTNIVNMLTEYYFKTVASSPHTIVAVVYSLEHDKRGHELHALLTFIFAL